MSTIPRIVSLKCCVLYYLHCQSNKSDLLCIKLSRKRVMALSGTVLSGSFQSRILARWVSLEVSCGWPFLKKIIMFFICSLINKLLFIWAGAIIWHFGQSLIKFRLKAFFRVITKTLSFCLLWLFCHYFVNGK